MKNFTKTQANETFNHQEGVVELFNKLGFRKLNIETSLTNGISHYVDVLDFKVVNEKRLYNEMYVFEGNTYITVRISDHASNLDMVCGGVSKNTMNLQAFKNLIETGAISAL